MVSVLTHAEHKEHCYSMAFLAAWTSLKFHAVDPERFESVANDNLVAFEPKAGCFLWHGYQPIKGGRKPKDGSIYWDLRDVD